MASRRGPFGTWHWVTLCALSACAPSGDDGTVDTDTDGDSDVVVVNPFEGIEPDAHYGAVAADVTWTLRGGDPVSLSELWDPGSVTVVYVAPDSSYHRSVLEGDWVALLEASPKPVRYVFAVYAKDAERRFERMKALRDLVDEALAELDDDAAAWWRDRVVLLASAPDEMGWVAALGAPNVRRTDAYHDGERFIGFVLDPRQRIRPLGELVDWARSGVRLDWLALEAVDRLHQDAIVAAAEARTTEVVEVFGETAVGTGWGGSGVLAQATIPADLSRFEGLEIDLDLDCFHVEEGDNAGDLNCPEWDRLLHLDLCEAEDPSTCGVELGRWVSPYTKNGRWIHDISPLLPLLADDAGQGGARWFRFRSIDNYKTTVRLRFVDDDTRPRPLEAVPLFSGGQLHAETNDRYDQPVDVAVPSEASTVEVVAVATGHSFGKDTKNCAEFCDHQHTFSVGGVSATERHPEAGSGYGCQALVGEGDGVVANQYGSWPFGRGGWCPGAPAAPWRADVTGGVVPGAIASVDYAIAVDGGPYDPVWYEPSADSDDDDIWNGDGVHPPGIWVPEVNLRSWLVSFAAPVDPSGGDTDAGP